MNRSNGLRCAFSWLVDLMESFIQVYTAISKMTISDDEPSNAEAREALVNKTKEIQEDAAVVGEEMGFHL